MKKLILPIVLLLFGTGAGVGAGILLKPAAEEVPEAGADLHAAATPCGDVDPHSTASHESPEVAALEVEGGTEFVPLSNQFVVPVIENDRLSAMVVASVSIETPLGQTAAVLNLEPRLRDMMLQDMFAHANIGGFSGNYTATDKMRILRQDLLRSARDVLGENALDVLILDIVRQDV